MKRPLLFLILLACLFISCDKPPKYEQCDGCCLLAEDGLVPLSVGNYWAYQQKAYLGEDIIIEGSTVTFYGEIVGDTIITFDGHSHQTAIWNWFNPPSHDPTPYKWLYSNCKDGLFRVGGIAPVDTLFRKNLYLKYPTQLGDKWEFPLLTYDFHTKEFLFTDTLTYTCMATNEPFETPAGSFSCYVYHYRKKQAEDVLTISDIYLYYVPGLGRVGSELKDNGVLKYRQVLYDYHLD
ncbi:MAG: hypothetical protein ISR82_00490 [Candidatus Marinimicrobia bacterium]|nr:hypothetical protein [Candidatus Neomarinimicrobiota bacterium]MBL7009681.1 hypothetical protein [Candidatus Neomarinimicrobiota bacterium]MBL7029576.1 hypothetical protein [Candidatus Neomarinimicrobiota bacterium]